MIEMHQDGDPVGRGPGDDESFYLRRGPGVVRLALAAPALAIASLVVAAVSLLVMNSADTAGETALISSQGRQVTQLVDFRVEAWVQWTAAIVALVLALAAALQLRSSRLVILDDGTAFESGADAEGPAGDGPGEQTDEALTDADLDVVLDLEERRTAVDPPQWVQALVGAAVIVSLVATAFTTFTMVDVLHAHPNVHLFGAAGPGPIGYLSRSALSTAMSRA